MGNEHALYSRAHFYSLLSQGQQGQAAALRLPRCSAGPIFIPRSNSRTLSPNAVGSSSSGRAGLGSRSLSRFLPWDPSETAGSSFQKPPGTAIHSKEVFLPSSSCSQPEQNKPQGKPRDMSTSADRFCRSFSWDGWDSAASQRGGTEQEPSA